MYAVKETYKTLDDTLETSKLKVVEDNRTWVQRYEDLSEQTGIGYMDVIKYMEYLKHLNYECWDEAEKNTKAKAPAIVLPEFIRLHKESNVTYERG